MPPIQRKVTSWKWRQSRPAGCSRVYDLASGMLPRPRTVLDCCSSCCSLTAFFVGLTACVCAAAGNPATAIATKNKAARAMRSRAARACMALPPNLIFSLRADGLAIGRLPAPGSGAVASLSDALLVDFLDDLTVAGKQRLGRTHLGAQRQFPLGEAVGAVFLVLRRAAVRLRPTGAERAFVHLATRAEIADPRILRRSERARIEAISTPDADVFRMQHNAIGRRIEGIHGTDRLARCVRAVHACHRHRALAGLAVVERDDPAPVDAPRHLMLVFAGGDARIAFDAAIGVAEKFHPGHSSTPYAAAI